jgi:Tfp pilus assembly protein PilO
MDRFRRYTGVILFLAAVAVMLTIAALIIIPQYNNWDSLTKQDEKITETLESKRNAKMIIVKKLKQLHESVISSQKKIYSPVENKLGDDALFFTLYSDVIEMVRANTIKIKSIDYKYNPAGDVFVKQKGALYFVCDVNIEVVSNYVNLGKLIQDLYQYPYYIKINKIDVVPYAQDKKILLSTISLRLYAHTTPDAEIASEIDVAESEGLPIDGATVPIPKE